MEMKQITLSVPTLRFGFVDKVKSMITRSRLMLSDFLNHFLRQRILYFIGGVISKIQERRHNQPNQESFMRDAPRRFANFNLKKILKTGFVFVIAGFLLFGLYSLGRGILTGTLTNKDTRAEVKGAKASQDIYRDFTFPLRNEKNEEVGEIKYNIEKAEFRDEIVVKGQKASAVKGRTFLIINLKVTNQFNQTIEINTKDYMRLSVNGNENEWLAADIHNDPVEVQAQSTKYTRIGFPVNDSDKNLVLRIGEINGDKESVNLELK